MVVLSPALHGFFLSHVQDFALELDEVSVGPFLQPAEIPLNDSLGMTSEHIGCFSDLVTHARLLRVESAPLSRSLLEDVKSINHQLPEAIWTQDC